MNKLRDLFMNQEDNFLKSQEKGEFFDLPKQEKLCQHPSHNPPTHLHIPEGKGYKHVCPSCKNVQIVIPKQTTL